MQVKPRRHACARCCRSSPARPHSSGANPGRSDIVGQIDFEKDYNKKTNWVQCRLAPIVRCSHDQSSRHGRPPLVFDVLPEADWDSSNGLGLRRIKAAHKKRELN